MVLGIQLFGLLHLMNLSSKMVFKPYQWYQSHALDFAPAVLKSAKNGMRAGENWPVDRLG